MADIFDLIAAQRRAVAAVLDTLTGDDWSSPSLCAGWRIQEMAAHLTMPFRVSNVKFFSGVLGSGGSIAKVMDKFARAHANEPASQLISCLRDSAGSHFVPPTFPPVASLTEIVVHGFDISIPTGRHIEVPEEVLRLVLDYLVSKKPGSVYTKRGLVHGVRLVSTDSAWSYGSGPEITGLNFGLIMLLARRPVGFELVSGVGVDFIRRQLAPG